MGPTPENERLSPVDALSAEDVERFEHWVAEQQLGLLGLRCELASLAAEADSPALAQCRALHPSVASPAFVEAIDRALSGAVEQFDAAVSAARSEATATVAGAARIAADRLVALGIADGRGAVARLAPLLPRARALRRPRPAAELWEPAESGSATSGADLTAALVDMGRQGRHGRRSSATRPRRAAEAGRG